MVLLLMGIAVGGVIIRRIGMRQADSFICNAQEINGRSVC